MTGGHRNDVGQIPGPPPERRPRIRVAAVLPRGDEVLLVRHRKGDQAYWMLPGGGLDWGETFEQCAAREVREETGLDVEMGPMLYVSEAIHPEGARHVVNVYLLGRVLGGELVAPEGDVIDQVAFLPLEQLSGITLYPAIADHLVASWRGGFEHPIRHLGRMWT